MNYLEKIFITGANGSIGRKLCRVLLNNRNNLLIVACCRDTEGFDSLLAYLGREKSDRISLCLSSHVTEFDFCDIDTVIHLAFARMKYGDTAIAASMNFSSLLFTRLKQFQIKRIINLSTQGIYGKYPEIRKEDTTPAPNTTYSMAKYGVECILQSLFSDSKTEIVNLRLDNVAQSQNLIIGLCRSVKSENLIKLVGGKQIFSYIDIDDAVNAIERVASFEGVCDWVYNVGIDCKRYTLIEIAGLVSEIAVLAGLPAPQIEIKEEDIQLFSGMDSKKFMDTFSWTPKIEIKEMIKRIFDSV